MRSEHDCHYLEQGVDDGAHSTILGATAVLRGGGRSREQYLGLGQGGILSWAKTRFASNLGFLGVGASFTSESWRLPVEMRRSLGARGAKRL